MEIPGGVVVSVEVVYSDKFFAEGKASDRVAIGVHVRGVYGDSHRVGQYHHHHSCLTGLTRQTDLSKNTLSFIFKNQSIAGSNSQTLLNMDQEIQ